jgi:hypothetical protein
MKEQGERFDGWRKSIVKLVEMDEKITLSEQMEEENVGPVILINKFNVKPEEVDQLLRAWAADAAYFKSQSGFISTQLHRGIAGSSVYLSTMQFGSLLSCIRGHLRTTSSSRILRDIHPAQSCLPTYSRKLLCLGSVWTDALQQTKSKLLTLLCLA